MIWSLAKLRGNEFGMLGFDHIIASRDNQYRIVYLSQLYPSLSIKITV